jgi:hypothetical protein
VLATLPASDCYRELETILQKLAEASDVYDIVIGNIGRLSTQLV